MIFFALLIFLPLIWFAPWWALGLGSFVLGYTRVHTWKEQWTISLVAGMVWAALAFIRDGQSYGLISKRLSGLLGLPVSGGVFLIVLALGLLFSLLWLRSGALVKVAFRSQERST